MTLSEWEHSRDIRHIYTYIYMYNKIIYLIWKEDWFFNILGPWLDLVTVASFF